jgi:opacity protein-like surface antigen
MMKKLFVLLVVLFAAGAAFAADRPVDGKKFEASTAIHYYSFKESGSSGSYGYLYVPLRFGWYIWKGLEIEPEVDVQFPLGSMHDYYDVSYVLSTSVFYNFKVGKKFVPFVGGGAGFGNGMPYPQYGQLYGDSAVDTSEWHVGCGVKYLLTNSVALRAEYRYNRYRYEYEGSSVYHFNIHQVLAGLSFFF